MPNSFRAIILRLPTQFISSATKLISWQAVVSKIDSTELFFVTTLHGPRKKHGLSIVGKACLQRRCIATKVLLLRALAPAGMWLPSHCLAMGPYVTIQSKQELDCNVSEYSGRLFLLSDFLTL
jgi:hypothetical protein